MEYVKGGCLFDFMKIMNDGDGMIEEYGRFFMNQILDAIEHMHDKGIIHRDIKPENMMVDEHMNIKVLDFGFSAYRHIDSLRTYVGTRAYMAPEIQNHQKYNGQ